MSTDDKNVAKLNRTISTLIAIFVVPLAYFMRVSQHDIMLDSYSEYRQPNCATKPIL